MYGRIKPALIYASKYRASPIEIYAIQLFAHVMAHQKHALSQLQMKICVLGEMKFQSPTSGIYIFVIEAFFSFAVTYTFFSVH